MIKIAMVRMDAALRAADAAGRMLLQVHDELLFEAPARRGRGGRGPGARDHGGRAAAGRARSWSTSRPARLGARVSRRFLLVGLTGGIATGKSTVRTCCARLGDVIVDADLLAREVVEPGQPALAAIVREFGADVLQPGRRASTASASAPSSSPTRAPRRLEAITHPAIRERFLRGWPTWRRRASTASCSGTPPC